MARIRQPKITAPRYTCRECGADTTDLGALSGLCRKCRNAEVAALERELGMKPGELGRE